MRSRANILVIGAGAVGGIVAAKLHQSEYNVTLVTKHRDIANKINNSGLHIFGYCGNHTVKVPAVANVLDINVQPDFIFIATKANDMPEAASAVIPLLHEGCRVISLQNGIVEEKLARIAGKKRTVACVVGWGATMHGKAELEQTSGGECIIGYLNGTTDDKLEQTREMLENIVPTTISEEILSHLYSKLIVNSCISTMGAISGLQLGMMLGQKKYRNIFLETIREAIAVSNAMDLHVKSYAGKLDYYKLLKWGKTRQHLFLILFGRKYRKLKSSSLQSLERRKKTEIHYFNGYISEKGAEFKIPTPVNDLLTSLVEDIEENRREIGVENFNHPGFDL